MLPLQRKIGLVEERLNSRSIQMLKEVRIRDIDDALISRKQGKTAAEYVLERLARQGFRDKGGAPDWVAFYRHARIEPDVWSTFTGNSHAPSKETLLKIIIGMRFGEDEAREFLALAGSGFRSNDFRDQVILACMDCGYYDVEDVYAILEEYGKELVRGKRRFRNIY